jgi:hypothetical protein
MLEKLILAKLALSIQGVDMVAFDEAAVPTRSGPDGPRNAEVAHS